MASVRAGCAALSAAAREACAAFHCHWRVERGEDDVPVVHEFWRHHEAGVYAPSPEQPTHTGKLTTDVPFPVDIDLRTRIEL